ncbi:MAG: zinc metallopeptidase RseP, partial [Pasteurellales bacterium]
MTATLSFLFLICVLVTVHEYGHFAVARAGGYVKMLNNEHGFAENERYDSKTVWQKMLIILAGPFANFIFAIFAYWAVFVSGVPTLKPVVGEVLPNSIVATANIPTEFEFSEINGKNVQDWEEVALAFIGSIGESNVEVSGHL